MRIFIHGFHCQMENNKNPKGRRASCTALLLSIWQWRPGIKSLMEITFLFSTGKIVNEFWVDQKLIESKIVKRTNRLMNLSSHIGLPGKCLIHDR